MQSSSRLRSRVLTESSPRTRPRSAENVVRARCPHCGTPVEGATDAFCCAGCETAYDIIHGAGLARYYEERSEFAPRPEPVAGGWAAVPVDTLPGGLGEVRLQIGRASGRGGVRRP